MRADISRAGLSKTAGEIVVTVLWAIPAHLWDFLSGVVAGLGANVFAARAINPNRRPGKMWLEFVIFLMSAAFGVAAGAIRRRVEENWKAGGSQPGDEKDFLRPKICKLMFCVAAAIVSVIAGLLTVLGG